MNTSLASIMTAPPIFVVLLCVAHVWVQHVRSYLDFVCKTFVILSFHTPNNMLQVLSLSSYKKKLLGGLATHNFECRKRI